MIIPDYVFFSANEYTFFSTGRLKKNTRFTVGINSSEKLVMTIISIEKGYYACLDNRGNEHNIDWDLEEFNNKQPQRNKNKWAFYNIF